MNNFTQGSQSALMLARREAKRLGHDGVDTEHLLLALTIMSDETLIHVLGDLGTTPSALRSRWKRKSRQRNLVRQSPNPFVSR